MSRQSLYLASGSYGMARLKETVRLDRPTRQALENGAKKNGVAKAVFAEELIKEGLEGKGLLFADVSLTIGLYAASWGLANIVAFVV